MKLIFRSSTVLNLKWLRRYYKTVFPEGEKHARHHYKMTCLTLAEHPLAGHSLGLDVTVREIQIPRTPFSFVYYVDGDEIVIIRILDGRAERPDSFAK